VFDDLERLAGLSSGSRLLELGCGTGKATLPLARRGHHIVALELGQHLAEQASRNLAGLANVIVVHASFDDWRHEHGDFDLVFAATAWHWLDPDRNTDEPSELLKPGGHLAFWSATHVFPDHGDPFFREIQPIYDGIGHGLPADATRPRPGELPEATTEIEASGLFDEVGVRDYDWEVRYNADSYIEHLLRAHRHDPTTAGPSVRHDSVPAGEPP